MTLKERIKFYEMKKLMEKYKTLAEEKENNIVPLNEEAEDNIKVEVDGEVIADTSVEEPVQPAVEETSQPDPKLGIVDALIAAINSEYETIQNYNSLIATCEEYGFDAIAEILKHVNAEENIHVGMFQHAVQTLSEDAKEIETGVEEAQKILDGEEVVHED